MRLLCPSAICAQRYWEPGFPFPHCLLPSDTAASCIPMASLLPLAQPARLVLLTYFPPSLGTSWRVSKWIPRGRRGFSSLWLGAATSPRLQSNQLVLRVFLA